MDASEVVRIVAQVTKQPVTAEQTLDQLVPDSLDLTDIVVALEQLTDRSISEAEVSGWQGKTLAEIAKLVGPCR